MYKDSNDTVAREPYLSTLVPGSTAAAAARGFFEAHVQPESGLLPVANVYPDARLWANTEAAAFLLLEPGDFRLR